MEETAIPIEGIVTIPSISMHNATVLMKCIMVSKPTAVTNWTENGASSQNMNTNLVTVQYIA